MWPLDFLNEKLHVPTKQGTAILIKVKSFNALLGTLTDMYW
jgi:hypothetical protein